MDMYDYPMVCTNKPSWNYIMKVLYELWFHEHGMEVEVTFEPVEKVKE